VRGRAVAPRSLLVVRVDARVRVRERASSTARLDGGGGGGGGGDGARARGERWSRSSGVVGVRFPGSSDDFRGDAGNSST